MAADLATFRADFPEFATTPDARVTFWLTLSAKMLNAERWADLLDHGMELFTAHHLAIDNANQRAAAGGGAVGQSSGPVASKAVDKVSVSYDTGAATLEGSGHWNLSSYGTQFYALLRMMGTGGYQL